MYRALLAPAALAIVFLVGPLASLLSLQLAVCVSSRVNDARSAQQIGALVILPIAGLLIAQVAGVVVLTAWLALAIAAGLVVANLVVLRIGRGAVRSRVDPDALEVARDTIRPCSQARPTNSACCATWP